MHPVVLVTGDSDGLGNAAARALLRRRPAVTVVGLSRRADDAVVGWAELAPRDRERYRRYRVDLADEAAVDRAIDEVLQDVRAAKTTIRAVVLANGTGWLDSELERNPSLPPLMQRLNVATPVQLTTRLGEERGRAVDAEARLLYYSGLVTHPSVIDPLLTRHAALKHEAVEALRQIWGERVTSVMPGAYRTPMLDTTIRKPDALLEWFALPPADPYARGGLSDKVAQIATGRGSRVPSQLIRPRINELLVSTNTADSMRKTLPAAIVRSARAVLAQTDQTDEDHDARVRHMQEHELYGADFPYEAILSRRLWPRWASVAFARLLLASPLGR